MLLPAVGWGQSPDRLETEWVRDRNGTLREAVRGEVLVRYREGVGERDRERVERALGVKRSRRSGRSVWRVNLSPERARGVIEGRVRRPEIEQVQPNYIYRLKEAVASEGPDLAQAELRGGRLPNDPEFKRQWGLYNEGQTFYAGESGTVGADSKAHLAWEVTQGSEEVIVAIFDTGIDYTHPDLAANMFVDDQGRHGVDCSPGGMTAGVCSDDPMDPHGHGTHVAGIVGAVGDNGIGVSGVNWRVRLMAVKIFSEDPDRPGEYITSSSSILAGFDYALGQGATISNHSYGGPDTDFLRREKIRDAGLLYDHLVIAASGNADPGAEGEEKRIYPAAYDLSNVISVASTNAEDQLSRFSHYGDQWVDLAAPGDQIYSTTLNEGYRYLSGTSMASPFVAGAAALARGIFPDRTHEEIRALLLDEADRLENLEGRVAGGRRLNMVRALPAARIWLTHGSISTEVEEVDLWVNDRLIESGLAYAETTDRLYLPAGVDLDLSIRPSTPLGSVTEWHGEEILFDRDRRYRVLFHGDQDRELDYFEDPRTLPEADRVSVRVVQLSEDGEPLGFYGVYPDSRPTTELASMLSRGEASAPALLPGVTMELDITREEERLQTAELPLESLAGERWTVWVTDGAVSGRFHLLLSGDGEGAVPDEVTLPAQERRHRSESLVLEENFPNPFRGETMIQFSTPESGPVRLEVVDLLGRRVQTLHDGVLEAGIHRISFDAEGLSSGVYLFRVTTRDASDSGKMMLVR